MYVIKRNGNKEKVDLNKITQRIKLLKGIKPQLDIDEIFIATKVVNGLFDGVQTSALDTLAAETCATMATIHPDYDIMAARLSVSDLHKKISGSFSEKTEMLNTINILDSQYCKYVQENAKQLDGLVDYNRDYNFDYFGVQTLKKSYLLKNKEGKIIESPQDMWMRTAVFLHKGNIEKIKETYDLLSNKYFTHATPTLFNAGTIRPQLSSCFLLDIDDDSIPGIYKTLSDVAKISQSAGGIGLAIHKIRSSGSYIHGTNGYSNGIVPMLRVFDATARYVDQCFTGNTIVYTQDGPKAIESLSTKDSVLTQDGSFKSVTKVIQHPENEYDCVKFTTKQSIEPTIATCAHPFFAIRGQRLMLNKSVILNRLNNGLVSPEYVELKDLKIGDFIGYPIPKFTQNTSLSEDDCRLYGLLLGDGHMPEGNNGFTIHCNSITNVNTLEFLRQYCSIRGITFSETTNESVTRFRANSCHQIPFTRAYLYDVNKEKYFHPSLLYLEASKSLAILKGLMDSDGHYGKKELLLEMSSKNVIESIRLLLLSLGVLTSGYSRDRIGSVSKYKNITTRKKTFTLRIPKVKLVCDYLGVESGEYTNYFEWNNILWSRIDSYTPTISKSSVFDLEVDTNHNYLTHSGLAHNGGGKRKGSIAIYLEPWHADIFEFLDLKKNHGKEELRARDLFYALWIPDLFMQRVEEDGDWTLFDPAKAWLEWTYRENDKKEQKIRYLYDLYGREFEIAYKYLESQKIGRTIKARELWEKILTNQIETGVPYMLYKDAANHKSNQKNLGTIKSSNLCVEILEYTSPEETAVCNLASISLPKFVDAQTGSVDYAELYRITKIITENLNRVIDVNYYPTPETKRSNFRHRPIGIGVQGLADCYALLRLPFDSPQAREVNKRIFETIYKGAIDASIELARRDGAYETYQGSPASRGELQFDLWGIDKNSLFHNWEGTRRNLSTYGLRNSLLLAPMPTASTSQILGNNEACEPFTSNLYTRRTLAGEFIVVNKHLLKELISLGIWSDSIRQQMMAANGSIQDIPFIPEDLKNRYKTAYEMSAKAIIDQAADRGPFICQSQSMNVFMPAPTISKLTSMHFYAWKKGLKTGMYYLRSEPARDAIKFTLNNDKNKENNTPAVPKNKEVVTDIPQGQACSIDDPNCEACGA